MVPDQPSRVAPTDKRFSQHMSAYPRRETAPEMDVRRLLHAAGMRYRIHYPVPGKPRRKIDIAFTKAKVAVFIDGCFWHSCPEHRVAPKSNADWWRWKLEGNVDRDADTALHLTVGGWQVLRFWEHESPEAVVGAVIEAVQRSA